MAVGRGKGAWETNGTEDGYLLRAGRKEEAELIVLSLSVGFGQILVEIESTRALTVRFLGLSPVQSLKEPNHSCFTQRRLTLILCFLSSSLQY